uniref:Uncharacterized protein n=1 Tax=Nelumbo nucifera TaxID=4432 RepID=A0A822Y7B8_NELNU|nr:TPA_asm: hypothetical protein HUJ06_028383 [Nelumbo nucifera]
MDTTPWNKEGALTAGNHHSGMRLNFSSEEPGSREWSRLA